MESAFSVVCESCPKSKEAVAAAPNGATIEVMKQPSTQPLEDELVQDMVAIITSFSGRVHGLRSAKKRQKIKNKYINNA